MGSFNSTDLVTWNVQKPGVNLSRFIPRPSFLEKDAPRAQSSLVSGSLHLIGSWMFCLDSTNVYTWLCFIKFLAQCYKRECVIYEFVSYIHSWSTPRHVEPETAPWPALLVLMRSHVLALHLTSFPMNLWYWYRFKQEPHESSVVLLSFLPPHTVH